LDLSIALENSRLDQTYNTPSLSTIFLMREQVDWFNQNGGIKWTAARSKASSDLLYQWADNKDYLSPFVQDKSLRSTVIATIDFDEEIEADLVAKVLRANGIVDVESYRKLGRNQLRIATFPAIELSDIQTLTSAIDWVVSQIH
ncbi:MAG: phosphoserine transaminase, partial [Candidatus Nanopelagicales bacterium]